MRASSWFWDSVFKEQCFSSFSPIANGCLMKALRKESFHCATTTSQTDADIQQSNTGHLALMVPMPGVQRYALGLELAAALNLPLFGDLPPSGSGSERSLLIVHWWSLMHNLSQSQQEPSSTFNLLPLAGNVSGPKEFRGYINVFQTEIF